MIFWDWVQTVRKEQIERRTDGTEGGFYEPVTLCYLPAEAGKVERSTVSLNAIPSFQGSDGVEWLDWLFDQNEGILRHEESGNHGNQFTWLIPDTNVRGVHYTHLPVCDGGHTVIQPHHRLYLLLSCGPIAGGWGGGSYYLPERTLTSPPVTGAD